MANTPENQTENGDEVNKIRAEVQQEINNAKQATNSKVAKEALANRIVQDLKDAQRAANEFKEAEAINARGGNLDKRKEGKQVRRAIIRAAEAAKEGIVVTKDKKTNQLLATIADRAPTDSQAASIDSILGDFISGEKPIIISKPSQPKSEFIQKYEILKQIDPLAAQQLGESLEKRASDYDIRDSTEMKQALGIAPEGAATPTQPGEDQNTWDYDKTNYYQRIFTPRQIETLEKLYSPQKLINYINHQIEESHAVTEEAKNRVREDLSNKILRDLNQIINQLHLKFQTEAPKKFFDEVLRDESPYTGYQAILTALKTAMNRSLARIRDMEQQGQLKDFKMFIHTEEKPYIEEIEIEVEGRKEKIKKPVPRLNPLAVAKPVSAGDYMLSLINNMNHMVHRQVYLHNSRAIYNHPAGEHGFYGQLAQYANELSATDIDEIMLLPDGQLVNDAFMLYDKFLEEDFAKMDWRHRSNQFSNQLERVNPQIEREIIEMLKIKYQDQYGDTELHNALNMAVGMSRGIFMNEPEKSSYADPIDIDPVTKEQRGLFASYSTNDYASLAPFNPLHIIYRWQGEQVMPMYYFLPIGREGETGLGKIWDHTKMWDLMKKYKESYLKGKGELPEKDLLIEQLVDVCNVGGPAKRRGWRIEYATRDFYVFHKEGANEGKMDVLNTFKALENIGYEIINDFIDSRIPDEFKIKAVEGDKYDFFKYVYENYFLKPGEKFSGLKMDNYLNELRKAKKTEALKEVKKGKEAPDKIDDLIEKKVMKSFLETAIAYEVAWRFPSKFLRMDRDRYHKDGVSRWRAVQEKMKLSRDDFDLVIKDLLLAESMLRQDISRQMRDQLQHHPELKLHNLTGIDNKLTEEKLNKYLEGLADKGMTKERIKNVVATYRYIWNDYINDDEFMSKIGKEIDEYTFTFGIEETDMSFMAFRGAGPRLVPRAIGDIGMMEKEVIGELINMPKRLHTIAIDGKHDFSPIIEYFKKVQNAYHNVHGPGYEHELIYKLAASVITYFKKDSLAKPLFGLFRLGRRNSIAAEVAGRSTAVWEWDTREIDRFIVALESTHLLRNTPYNLAEAPKYEPRWINFFGRPIKTLFKRRKIDWEWNSKRLRKEFGASWLHIGWEILNNFMPIMLFIIAWQFFQRALKESEGKK